MELPTGTIIDDSYRILERISLGREVDTYRVEPLTPGPAMMIHMLRTALLEGDPGLEIFEDAGLELCRFSHDAFPEVVDFGRFMVRPFVVTELAEGSSLAELLDRDALRSDQALRAMETVREAMHAAHHAGMIHGALSADSVFMTPDGEIQIPDLGARWIAATLKAKGAPLDPSPDLHALVNLSQVLMRKAKRRPAPPPPLPIDPELDDELAPAPPATIRPMTRPPELHVVPAPEPIAVESEAEAPPPAAPQPEAEAPPVAATRPAAVPPPPPPADTPRPVMVRLPPPPVSARPAAPPPPDFVRTAPPAPAFARTAPPPPPAPAPVPAFARTAPPPPAAAPALPRTAPPRFDSFSDEPMMGAAALQPSYVTFFKEMFSPGVGAPDSAPRASGPIEPAYVAWFRRMFPEKQTVQTENDARRFLNLAMVCGTALLMLAAVLNF